MAGGSEDFPTDRPSESSLLRKSCFRKTPEPLQKTKIGQKEKERRKGKKTALKKKSQTPALRVMLLRAVGPWGWSGSASGHWSGDEPSLPSVAPWDVSTLVGYCSFWESIWG